MTLSYELDVKHGFQPAKGSRSPVGYLIAATICGTALAADLTGTDPVTGSAMPVAGVLSQIQWGETPGAALTLAAQVSARNLTVLQQLFNQQITNTAAALNFRVYEYDNVAGGYFRAFAPYQPPLAAIVARSGNSVELAISPDPGPVHPPPNYAMSLTTDPAPGQMQVLSIASSQSATAAMPWGSA